MRLAYLLRFFFFLFISFFFLMMRLRIWEKKRREKRFSKRPDPLHRLAPALFIAAHLGITADAGDADPPAGRTADHRDCNLLLNYG